MLRTHTCGELRTEHSSLEVTLAGWVHRRRDHGPVLFIDLRDRYGITQLVADPATNPEARTALDEARSEYVLQVTGRVQARPPGMANPNLATGAIEVEVHHARLLNRSKLPPLLINRDGGEDESLRLKYRYLDLRRERMQHILALRHRAVKFMRDFLDARGFYEIETPMMMKSTPEGARDYLVPSRLHPGTCYALPQSPQQLKQLLMVAGFDKYFQIARCMRDEDLRADRQPEFTQLDLEMSFVEQDDVLEVVESLLVALVPAVTPHKRLLSPFPRLTYAEAMARFGTDKPDLRYGLELVDISDLVADSGFDVFTNALGAQGQVKGVRAPGCAPYSRRQLDELQEIARAGGARGAVFITIAEGRQPRTPLSRYLGAERLAAIVGRLDGEPGDLLVLVADQPASSQPASIGYDARSVAASSWPRRIYWPSPGWSISRCSSGTPMRDVGRPNTILSAWSTPRIWRCSRSHLERSAPRPMTSSVTGMNWHQARFASMTARSSNAFSRCLATNPRKSNVASAISLRPSTMGRPPMAGSPLGSTAS